MEKIWLAFESCDGNESLVGVYRSKNSAVRTLKSLVKRYRGSLSQEQEREASMWRQSIGGDIIECEFISDDLSLSFYAVQHEVEP